jgi:hypothetical protein
VTAALSAGYDGDLAFERRDLERFVKLYHTGPEGIFLKRGKTLSVRVRPPFPFVHITKREDPNPNRLYFGKAILYPVVAAPFVRALGLNGILVLHVLLLAVVGVSGYLFLSAQSSPLAAAVFTTAFLGACVLPVYGVFLMPEIFNFALVFVAYVCWLYKEVSPRSARSGPWTDVVAAVLLGLGTYSKPIPIGVLVAPLVAFALLRRRIAWGIVLGAVAVASAAGCFAWNAAISGEFNYQGGDRKIFYGAFPFDAPDATWERRGGSMGTEGGKAQEVLASGDRIGWFAHNLEYFFVGRHFGFIPYFFPGVVAIVAWLFSRARSDLWRVLTFMAFAGASVVLLLVLPFTWSGGGGPPGNRYLFNVYPALFFLIPPATPAWLGVLAWVGGALFTAKMLVNPFVAAKYPNQIAQRGLARSLPVELTMANDLPVMLEGGRAHAWFSDVLTYFLDQHAYNPEVVDKAGHPGVWIAGDGRADILVRCAWPIDRLIVTATSPIRTTFIVAMGGPESRVSIEPGRTVTFEVPASGVRDYNSFAYLLTARSTEGFTPHMLDPTANDYRNLGVMMQFRVVRAATGR